MAKKNLTQQQDAAASYGWALAVLRSNPELSKLFDRAINGPGSPYGSQRFVAELRNTKWYKTRGQSARQNEVLRNADPGEYKRRLSQQRAVIADSYQAMYGTGPSERLLTQMTNQAFMLGYSDNEIHDLVGRSFNVSQQMKKGIGGTLGEAERQIRSAIEDYGLDMGEAWIGNQLNYVATGRADATSISDYLRKQAIGKYGAFKNELESGMTVRDIAEPYKQLMAKTLEISDKSLTISDPSIQKALLARAPAKGGKPGAPQAMPLWQFESQLKADPRWNGTQNAQDSIMAAGRKVLADWGLVSGNG